MNKVDFDFVKLYRTLQPQADRDLIQSRQSTHNALVKEATSSKIRIVELLNLAYGIPGFAELEKCEWFSGVIKREDSIFSLEHDREEAARIATAALSNLVKQQHSGVLVAVLAASLMGKRHTPDDDELAQSARRLLADMAKSRGLHVTAPQVTQPNEISFENEVAEDDQEQEEDHEEISFDDVSGEMNRYLEELVSDFNRVIAQFGSENAKLSEEIDMLWWHIGGHSFLLDQPLAELDEACMPIVVGIDVASMVAQLPGPHGAYGIIRNALGENANKSIKLLEATKPFDAEFSKKMKVASENYPGFLPVHVALASFGRDNAKSSNSDYKNITGFGVNTSFTFYELAIQAYHERLLVDRGWFQ